MRFCFLSGICPPWFVTFRVDNWGKSFLFPSKCADRETHFLGGKYGKKGAADSYPPRFVSQELQTEINSQSLYAAPASRYQDCSEQFLPLVQKSKRCLATGLLRIAERHPRNRPWWDWDWGQFSN